jgi:hypothetical protein
VVLQISCVASPGVDRNADRVQHGTVGDEIRRPAGSEAVRQEVPAQSGDVIWVTQETYV